MRLVIQGSEVSVTVKADRDLTTQEIVSAHQLATGVFEALFVSEDLEGEDTDRTEAQSDQTEIPKWVQVEMMCPVCRFKGRRTTKWGNTFTKCPSCETPLKNRIAADKPGVPDKAGNYYLANDRMPPKNGSLTDEDKELLKAMQRH
ncbi:MAG: hypothetical protein ACLTXM_18670 [Enterococcus sp.]